MANEIDLNYSIGQVSEMLNLPVSTIRFYENEFASYLNITKTQGGHRRFRPDDLEKLKYIHDMVHNQKKTLKDVKATLISDKDPMLLRKDIDLLLEVFENLVENNVKIKKSIEELYKRVAVLEEEKSKKKFKLF
ncbi:MAG TPA: MerR family transcriptional regulator [Acidobacteriota bacterium]|nr:MerR family transcriptional regulator [Acidobacteriota bacterium]HQO19099.1 MerR family transcriptional regulator [Acidobacteriota bacterium]HQQ46581.1 MerR family transcriptional regulator [Acidobacteriota bacterium]